MDADNDIVLAQYLGYSARLVCRFTIRFVGQYKRSKVMECIKVKGRTNVPYYCCYVQNKIRFLVVLMST